MICAILYPENSHKYRFDDLQKHAENNYILNMAEYQRTVTEVQILLLILLLLDRYPCTEGVRKLGQLCSISYTQA